MTWRDAPLYVEAHDLACWVVERAGSWSARGADPLGPLVTAAACDLTTAVALALTFPGDRPLHLAEADRAIVRLRTLLRLAGATGLLSAGGLRFACGKLQAAGKMVGGWRRRTGGADPKQVSGDGPPAATGG